MDNPQMSVLYLLSLPSCWSPARPNDGSGGHITFPLPPPIDLVAGWSVPLHVEPTPVLFGFAGPTRMRGGGAHTAHVLPRPGTWER